MSSNLPLVSIIMSARNCEDSVGKACKSILNQTFQDIEFLIVDDCSTDETFKILHSISEKDKRIKLYKNEKNLGLTKSINNLIKLSKGKYIARQDADDISESNRIEYQIQYLNKSRVDAVATRASILGSTKLIPGISFYLPIKFSMKFKNPFIHGTLMIRKDVLEKIGYYDEDFYYSQDYKLFLDLLKNGFKIKNLNKNLYKLNNTNNISENFKEQQKYYFNCAKKGLTPTKPML